MFFDTYQKYLPNYQGIIKIIDKTVDDHQYASVQFLGYGNEESVWLLDLMESKGEEWREWQMKCAKVCLL